MSRNQQQGHQGGRHEQQPPQQQPPSPQSPDQQPAAPPAQGTQETPEEPDPHKVAAAEKLEKERLEAEAAARAAAARAEQAAVEARAPRPVQAPVREVGDINVMCLKDNPRARLGNRDYNLRTGQTIQMHPGHAVELEQTGWVIRRG